MAKSAGRTLRANQPTAKNRFVNASTTATSVTNTSRRNVVTGFPFQLKQPRQDNFSRITAALTEQRHCGFHLYSPDALLRSNAWFVELITSLPMKRQCPHLQSFLHRLRQHALPVRPQPHAPCQSRYKLRLSIHRQRYTPCVQVSLLQPSKPS